MTDKIDKKAFQNMMTSSEADASAVNLAEKDQDEGGFMQDASGIIHGGLAAAGMVPGVGNIADIADAGLYALEGDKVGAGLSLAAAVPGAGLAVGAGKLAKAGGNIGRSAREVAEHGVHIPRRPRGRAAMEADRTPATLRSEGATGMEGVRRTESVIEDLGSRADDLYNKLTGSNLDLVDYQNYLDELMTINPELARRVMNQL
jgi:hypothetical protein